MVSIVLAGGGTAGHISPMVATAEALRAADPSVTLTCVGTPKGIESRVVPEAGLDLTFIPAVPFPRAVNLDLFTMPGRLTAAVVAARRILARRKAGVVVGFGGYASLPVYLAARSMRIPVVVHEQNPLPGLANRLAARFADRVCVSFPSTPLPRPEYVGLPVRAAISGLDRTSLRGPARRELGLPQTGPVLLVSGGSQGAASINRALDGALGALLDAGVSVLHVLGPKNMTPTTIGRTDVASGAVYVPVAYVDRMERAYAAADLMVGRSGAGTVVETAVVGLPGIFVPLPHGNGEQARNATTLVEAGGCILVADADLSPERLRHEVLRIILDPQLLSRMAAAGQGIMPADAAGKVAAIVLEEARR
ncbi:MAG: undecaprenyldiphospho-muramoylpentapeptide beta-N-acetylglucosaminyltransferase [Propionibacteriaceae bacterium]